LKIIKLVANNIKKLKAIEITPKGDVVVITGKNGQGKTNVLEAIWYALAGSKNIPTEPIRKGEEEGDIELDLGEYIVTRKFTKGGENTYLEVRNKDGAKFPSPQALLDKLIGDVSFNPIDLMKASNRDEMLLDIAGLSGKLEELDKERQEKYSQRTFENREAKKLEAQIKKDVEKNQPIHPIDAQDLLEEMENIKNVTHDIKTVETTIENLKETMKLREETINSLKEKIKLEEEKNAESQTALNESKKDLKILNQTKEELGILEEIREEFNKVEEINRKARDFLENEKIKAACKERKEAADRLTERIAEIDYIKETLIGEANFPVPEMGCRDGKVTLNDIPLNQLSKSEQVLLGIQIQMELHPDLKVILIPDASLLDSDSMKALKELAKDKDYQLWVERVEDEKVGILIEDGTIKADNQ
jgi:DNA repair exonuclease SbcCD ATPase subunit